MRTQTPTQDYFPFRIMQTADGVEVIDETLLTPFDALTPIMQIEYIKTENALLQMKRQKEREQAEQEHVNPIKALFNRFLRKEDKK